MERRPLGLPCHLLAVACPRTRARTLHNRSRTLCSCGARDLCRARDRRDRSRRRAADHRSRAPPARASSPPRGRSPAAALRGLDAVLVSHAHWDHLDVPSLERLGKELPIVCPQGVSGLLAQEALRPCHNARCRRGGEDRRAHGASGSRRARRKPRPARRFRGARLRHRGVADRLLRWRHRPVRRPRRHGASSTSHSSPSPAGARRSARGISTPSGRPRRFGGCNRGSRSRSTGARWRRWDASRMSNRRTSSPGLSQSLRRRRRSDRRARGCARVLVEFRLDGGEPRLEAFEQLLQLLVSGLALGEFPFSRRILIAGDEQ